MYTNIIIQADERGLLFEKGQYKKVLQPGSYRIWKLRSQTVTVMKVTEPFEVKGMELPLFLQDAELVRELEVVEVSDHEVALHSSTGSSTAC